MKLPDQQLGAALCGNSVSLALLLYHLHLTFSECTYCDHYQDQVPPPNRYPMSVPYHKVGIHITNVSASGQK